MIPRLATSFLRLFVVQGSWNYDRMLGIGIGLAAEPLLRDLARVDGEAGYRAAVARSAGFFNSHPYLAGLAVGATARAEHERVAADQVERLRAALVGPLGSLGDRLVWAGWLPMASGLALAAVALGAGWLAVAAFLVVYNVAHLALRWWALGAGWTHGTRVAAALQAPLLQRVARLTGPAMALAVGVALPTAGAALATSLPPWSAAVVGAVVVAGVGLLWWKRTVLDGNRLGLSLAVAALAVGWVLW